VVWEAWFNLGIEQFHAGDYQAALASFNQVLNFNSSHSDAWTYRGLVLGCLNRHQEEIASYDQAIGSRADHHSAWHNRGAAMANLNYFEEAIASFDQALSVKPDYSQSWTNRAYVLYKLGRWEEAVTSYDRGLALNPNSDSAWSTRGVILCDHLQRYEDAVISFEQAIALKPDNPEAWCNRGVALQNLNRNQEAIDSCTQALSYDLNYATAWYLQGKCFYSLGCSEEPLTNQGDAGHILNYLPTDRAGYFKKALTSYNRALAIKPNSRNILISQADALRALCRFEEALNAYDYTVDLDPNDYIAWHNRGIVLENLRRSEEALASYDYALEVNPNFAYTWYHRANLLLNQFRQYEEALISYNRSLELDPNLYQAWHGRGWVLNAFGRYEEAIASHEHVINLTRNQYFPAWLDKGKAILSSQGYEAAIQLWSEGLYQLQQNISSHAEGCGELHHAKGEAHYQQGRQQENPYPHWRDAKRSLQKALKLLCAEAFPEKHLEALLDLVTVCRGLNQVELAQELLRHGTDLLGRLLSATPSNGQKILLERKFARLNQLRVDELLQSRKQVEALELAEERKNVCLSWLHHGWSDTVPSPKYQHIQKLLNFHSAAIYWHVSPAAITTFILRHNKPLKALVLRYRQPPQLLCAEATTDNLTYTAAARKLQDLENWLAAWKQDYQGEGKDCWRQEMLTRLNELSKVLNIPEILPYLSGIDQLILLPHRDLHLLPLNALFAEQFTIRYLPSAQVGLDRQQIQCKFARRQLTTSVLNVENSQDDLPYAALESEAIAQLYPNTKRIQNSAATQLAVIQALQFRSEFFHFSGHAYHDLNLPSESSLRLANDQRLTLRDIFELDLSNYNLVCLSACETGMTGQQGLVDEFVGLASGFLAAGTTNVVSSLWKVSDISTAFLMIRFYENLPNSSTVAIALNQAQNWLRNLTSEEFEIVLDQLKPQIEKIFAQLPKSKYAIFKASLEQTRKRQPYPFANPYYWAAFTATGI
jgi:CHAT domain-containing protein/Flp pilus assembly protein TadD